MDGLQRWSEVSEEDFPYWGTNHKLSVVHPVA